MSIKLVIEFRYFIAQVQGFQESGAPRSSAEVCKMSNNPTFKLKKNILKEHRKKIYTAPRTSQAKLDLQKKKINNNNENRKKEIENQISELCRNKSRQQMIE